MSRYGILDPNKKDIIEDCLKCSKEDYHNDIYTINNR